MLVGALARDLCLPAASRTESRKTDDADLAMLVEDWTTLDVYLERCEPEFEIDRAELRMRHRGTGIPVDVAPCGALEDPPGSLRLRKSIRVLNMRGIAEAFETATPIPIGVNELLVPTPSAFAVLKLLSFHDRRAHRDLRDLGYVARRAPVDDGAIFSDDALVEGFADGSIVEPDVPTWQLGRAIAATFSAEAVAAFARGLTSLADEEPLIRAQLVIEDGTPLLDPDDLVASADRLVRVLLTAVEITRHEGE